MAADIGAWLGNLKNAIGNWFSTSMYNLGVWFGGIGDWLESLWQGIKDVGTFISNIPQALGDFFESQLDRWFTPSSSFSDQLSNVPVLTQLSQLSSELNVESKKYEASIMWNGKKLTIIDTVLFDPYVSKFRSILSAVFFISTFIACVRMVLGVFNVSVGGNEERAVS